jgi:hypothetical protein
MINALFMAAILSFCIFLHNQCTAENPQIQFGGHPIFAMGATSHETRDLTGFILFLSHANEQRLGIN